jgi:hypothetical protein
MMPKRLTPPQVIAQRRGAVEGVISTTNWTDKFVNADKFPQITQAPAPAAPAQPGYVQRLLACFIWIV